MSKFNRFNPEGPETDSEGFPLEVITKPALPVTMASDVAKKVARVTVEPLTDREKYQLQADVCAASPSYYGSIASPGSRDYEC